MTTEFWVAAGFVAAILLLCAVALAVHVRPRTGAIQPDRTPTQPGHGSDDQAISADLREIRAWLLDGARCVVVGGPPGAGQRALLAELASSASGLRVSGVIDLTSSRPADGVDLLDDVAASLRRNGLADFRRFARSVSAYRAHSANRRTTADRVGSAAQQGVAIGGAMLPVVGPGVAEIAKSDAATTMRELATERAGGSGDLSQVYSAFVEDLQEAAKAEDSPLVVVLDGIDERPDDPAVRSLVQRVLPRVVDVIALVTSARDVDVDLGTAFADRKPKWLARMADDTVQAELRNKTGLPDSTVADLVSVVDGSPERLQNIVAFHRTTRLDPSEAEQVARFVSQARAWADSGQVYQALQILDTDYQPLAFVLSALRWVNRPLLEEVAAATRALGEADVRAGDLFRPERRPSWLVPDRWGWRIGNDPLRRAMLDDFRRSNPDLLRTVHASAAEYHRRALWVPGLTASEPVPADPLRVPTRSRYRERRDDRVTADEAEWLYHLLALDPDVAFPIVLDRVAEALQAGEDRAVLHLLALEPDLELLASQRHALRLISESVDARLRGQLDPAARLLEEAVSLVPRDTAARVLLLCELGTLLGDAERPVLALRSLTEAWERAKERISRDARCLRAACLARGIQGMILRERDPASSAGQLELEESLAMAQQAGDVHLLAEVHKLRVRALASLGLAGSERAAREALAEIDASVAPDASAVINHQLAHALTFRENPDYGEADRLLRKSLHIYQALGEFDHQVEVLCQQATLELLRGNRAAAAERRAGALAMSRKPAAIHALLGNLAGWAGLGPRATLEYRCACARDALSRLPDDDVSASPPDRLGTPDLNALLATYAAELDDEDGRKRFLAAAQAFAAGPRTQDGRDLLAAAEEGAGALARVRQARQRCEAGVLNLEGEPLFRYQLAYALMAVAERPDEHPVDSEGPGSELEAELARRTEIAHVLRAAGAASSDEPAQVLSLAAALERAAAAAESTTVRNELVATLRTRVGADRRDPELHAALGDALTALDLREDTVQEYQAAYDLDPTTARLLQLTSSLSWANQRTLASRLVEQVLDQRGPEPVLLEEMFRLLTSVTNAEEEQRAKTLAKDHPNDARFALLAGRKLALTARKRADARRARDASKISGQPSDASDASAELPAELLTEAVSWLRTGAQASGEVGPLLEAAELLLDIVDVAPADSPTAWEVLEPVLPALTADSADPSRVGRCLARIARWSPASSSSAAAAALEVLRTLVVAGRVRDLLALEPESDVDALPPLVLEVGPLLVDRVNPAITPEAQRLYADMIHVVLQWVGGPLGFDLPGVRVRGAEGAGYEATLLVRGVPRDRRQLGGALATTLDTGQVEVATGRPGRPGILPDGRPGTWLDDDQKRALDRLGEETFDTRGLLCLLLLDALPRHAAELLDTQRICDLVTSTRADPQWASVGLPTAAAVLRRLVADGLPITDLRSVLGGLDPSAPLRFGPSYLRVHERLAPGMITGLLVRRPNLRLVRLGSDEVRDLTGQGPPVPAPVLGLLPLPGDDVLRIRAWAVARLPAGDVAVVVPDDPDRLSVAELLRGAGVGVPVLAPADIGEFRQPAAAEPVGIETEAP